MKRNLHHLLLSFTSGFILFLAWPPLEFTWLAFIGLVPLLSVERDFRTGNAKGSFFLHCFLAFLVWNSLTTWWIWNSTKGGAVMAIAANSLLMTIPLVGYHSTSRRMGEWVGYAGLVAYWLTFEFIHYQWELTWTWLSLGNVFAMRTSWIQWYEYTGVLGGSVWVLVINILLFHPLQRQAMTSGSFLRKAVRSMTLPLVLAIVPLLVSKYLYYNYAEKENPVNIVVVQPNIDPYNEKFSGLSDAEQLEILVNLSLRETDANTDYLVWPETALQHQFWIDEADSNEAVLSIREKLGHFPRLKVVSGLVPFKLLKSEGESPTARRFIDGGCCYDVYNSAIQLNNINRDIAFYHKSKLVIGVERIPYPEYTKFLSDFALNMGGTSGSLATQEERSVFFSPDSTFGVAPVICYESVMGDFISGFVRNGANLIFIITNDGWWGNTPGHRQHLQYARLRAVELRRSIARSANTGISCFINQRGDISSETGYWQPAAIKGTVNGNDEITFYARNGDYIGSGASLLTVAFILATAAVRVMRRNRRVTSS